MIEHFADALPVPFEEKYPHLEKFRTRIHNLPGVKEYIAKRP